MHHKFQYREITPSAIYSILFRKNGQTLYYIDEDYAYMPFFSHEKKNYMHNYAVMNSTCLITCKLAENSEMCHSVNAVEWM